MKHKNSIEALFTKYKEIVLYLFFGVLATVVSIGSFTVLYDVALLNEHLANIISWVLAVSFAFMTNRTWVFVDAVKINKSFIKQMIEFFSGRVLSLAVEEVFILVFVSMLSFNAFAIKVITQVIVIVLNYFISKFWVFNKRL